jgi:multiple sugar transport system ATP-binding protein
MASVELKGVRKEFGREVVALHDLHIAIADQEFVSLLGPSGCGKSTALRIIAGLETPTAGRVLFDGEDITGLAPAERNIAMVFQSYALYPHMSVRQNLEYGLRKRGVARDQRTAKVAGIAAMLQIEGLLERYPRQLSGGQRQRVALGRALIRDPRVFLLDEPLSNLDAKLRVHMRAEIAALREKVRTTMVYVTHDQLEAMTLSDRIIVMDRGRVQQVGTPEAVYARPANRFVAEFIGTPSMSIVPGELAADGGGLVFRAPGVSIALPGAMAAGIAGGGPRPVLLGVRPENVLVPAPDGAGAAIEARVRHSELAGADRHLILDIGGPTLIARTAPDVRPAAGEIIRVALDPAALHLFDAATEARIN